MNRAPATAKLNLSLVVGPLRDDGRHEVATVYQRNKLPARFEEDTHAMDSEENGTEYLAMIVEMMVYDHAAFDRSVSPAEMRWLATNFGDCFSKLPHRAPSYLQAERDAAAQAFRENLPVLMGVLTGQPLIDCGTMVP